MFLFACDLMYLYTSVPTCSVNQLHLDYLGHDFREKATAVQF